MWKEGDLEDDKIYINIEDKQFLCNRTTLCLHSSYFDVMFHGNFIEKEEKFITLKDVNVNGFSNIIKFLIQQPNNTKIVEENAFDIIECASMLQFQEIKETLVQYLMNELRIDNCLQIWEICELLDIHPLFEQAKYKACKEFHQVVNLGYFKKIAPKHLHSYLSNTFIYCNNEMEIFEAGMKWWMEYSINNQNNEKFTEEINTKYLLLVLSCVDFKSVNSKDVEKMINHQLIKINKNIINILKEMQSLLIILQNKNNCSNVSTYEELDCNIKVSEETKRLFSHLRREKILLNCIVTSEPGESNKPNLRIMNISYYDEKSKSLMKVFESNSNFQKKCVYNLKGCKIMSYDENLLLFGGYFRHPNHDNDVLWIYYTEKDEWQYLTKMPKIRDHFSSYISNDKLFIIGGMGAFRKECVDVFYFDLKTHKWSHEVTNSPNLSLTRVCNYKNKLLFLSVHDNAAYLFNEAKIFHPFRKLHVHAEKKISEHAILFSIDDFIYIIDQSAELCEFVKQGNNLIQKNVSRIDTIKAKHGYTLNYIFNKNNVYMFTKIKQSHFDFDINFRWIHEDDVFLYDLELHCFNIRTKSNRKLIEIKKEYNQQWHMHKGCFQLAHYKAVEYNFCISKFIL